MLIDFLLRQRCEVRRWLRTERGRDVYGPAETRACRLQTGRHLSRDNGADTVEARAMMFCTGEMIPERSRVICEGRTYIVTACRRARGFGEEHLEVSLE